MKTYHYYARTFTPQEAAEILAHRNSGNRKMKKAKIRQFTASMNSGRWRFTPVPILLEEHTGRLLDGQNRLQAVVESGKSQTFMVCDNVHADVMSAIDQGASRSPTDHLMTCGITGQGLAPLLLAILSYKQMPEGMWSVNKPISNQEYVDTYHAETLLTDEALGQGRRCNKEFRLISATDFSFVYYLLKTAGVEQRLIDDFLHRLASGIGLEPDCIIYQYRKFLVNDPDRYAGRRNRRQHSVNNILKTFNAYTTGTTSGKAFRPALLTPTPQIIVSSKPD